MIGLSTLSAAPWRQTIGGAEYWLSPLTLSDWAILEERLRRGRRNPIEVAKENLDGLCADDKRALLEAALKQASGAGRVTAHELMDYLATPAGAVLAFWLSLRKQQPQLTEDQAAELLQALGQEELARVMSDIEGADEPVEDPTKNRRRRQTPAPAPSPGSTSSTR